MMTEEGKTKEQLTQEMAVLRQRIAVLDSTSTVTLRFEYEIGALSRSWHHIFQWTYWWRDSDSCRLKYLASDSLKGAAQ